MLETILKWLDKLPLLISRIPDDNEIHYIPIKTYTALQGQQSVYLLAFIVIFVLYIIANITLLWALWICHKKGGGKTGSTK